MVGTGLGMTDQASMTVVGGYTGTLWGNSMVGAAPGQTPRV